jgi:Bacterial transcriptional activator domain
LKGLTRTSGRSVDVEAARLTELRRAAAEEPMDAELACGHHDACAAGLERMAAEEPFRERRWAMLMLALYRCGRQADALSTYQRARTVLATDLGLEPGPELRALERAVVAQDGSLDLAGPPPESSTIGAPPVGEARVVFILFSDVVASTELLDRLVTRPPRTGDERMSGCFETPSPPTVAGR